MISSLWLLAIYCRGTGGFLFFQVLSCLHCLQPFWLLSLCGLSGDTSLPLWFAVFEWWALERTILCDEVFFFSCISSVQLLSCVWLFVTPWFAAHQASLSITNSRSLPKLMSIESVMPSSNLILCHPLLFLPPIPPSIRVFSNESTLRMRRPKVLEFQL